MPKSVVLLIALSVCFAQQKWIRTYGGTGADQGYAVQQTADGGYVALGFTASYGAGQSDLYLLRVGESGDTLWTRTFGGSSADYGYSVSQTPDGGFIVTGQTYSFGAGSGDVYLIKTDAAGNAAWTRTHGGPNDDVGGSVRITPDAGYIIAGFSSSFGAGSYDAYLVKTDSAGDTLWTRAYGGTEFDYVHSVQQTPDSGFIAAGGTSSFGAGQCDCYLIRTGQTGDTLWTRALGGSNNDRGNCVQPTADAGYIVAGVTSSFGVGQGDVWLIKIDASGDTAWTRTFGGANDDWGNSVQQTPDRGYIIAGWTSSYGAGSYDVYLIKTDSAGDVVWTRTFGGTADDRANSVQPTADGGYVVAGFTYSFGSGTPANPNLYLIKTDANGIATVEETGGVQWDPEIRPRAVPNPFHSHARIPEKEKDYFIVTDIAGRTAGKYRGDKIGDDLPAGVYFIMPQSKSQKPIRVVKIK